MIQFHYQTPTTLSGRNTLRGFIAVIFKKERLPLKNLNIVFCDDDYLLNLNRQYLKHDFYTDILSFPLSRPGEPLIAEIYISIQRVRENAKTLKTSFKEELHRVIFHGTLHFCGYKDKSQSDIKLIRKKEDKYLKVYFKIKT